MIYIKTKKNYKREIEKKQFFETACFFVFTETCLYSNITQIH